MRVSREEERKNADAYGSNTRRSCPRRKREKKEEEEKTGASADSLDIVCLDHYNKKIITQNTRRYD